MNCALSYGAACCSVLQYVAVCCSVVQSAIPAAEGAEELCVNVIPSAVTSSSLLACVAACCSVLQRVAACCTLSNYFIIITSLYCKMLLCVAVWYSALQYVAVKNGMLQCFALSQPLSSGAPLLCCSALQCVAVYSSTLQCVAVCGNESCPQQ